MFARYLLLAFASLLLASSPHAQTAAQEERREPMLTVLGRGRYEVKPDLALFQATVATTGKTLEAAIDPHQEKATRALKVIEGLQAEGLEIEKSNFNVQEKRSERPIPSAQPGLPRSEKILEGYVATTRFSLKTTSIGRLNQIITKLTGSNLFQIDSVRFQVVQERAALNQARRAAMLDAREQARAYSEPVDLELEQIISITDGDAEAPSGEADLPSRRPGTYAMQIVPPATVEFTASVNVTWRIAARKPKQP
jgi:uncharacterized protein YggE